MTTHRATDDGVLRRRRRFVSLAVTQECVLVICEEGRLWYEAYDHTWVEAGFLPEIEDQDLLKRQAPLLWVLWHHQGAGSSVGQPIRDYLGMGQFERMTAQQIQTASNWADLTGAADPTPPPAPDGFVNQLACLLANWLSNLRPGADCTPLARDVICVLADWLELRGNHGSAAELRKEADR